MMQIICEEPHNETVLTLYHQLREQYGIQTWWPADTPFEICLGAILTQATAWRNVVKTFDNLKAADAFTPQRLLAIGQSELEKLLRPSRYYRAKAKKVRAFIEHITERPMHIMFEKPVPALREELLSIYGIGPETADSIILYAAKKPSFVVDTYTYRLLSRLGWVDGNFHYAKLRDFFMENLPHDAGVFNEYHTLIVQHGARVCQKTPKCHVCNLQPGCAYFSVFREKKLSPIV